MLMLMLMLMLILMMMLYLYVYLYLYLHLYLYLYLHRSGSLGEEELAVAVMSGHDLGAISPRPNAVSEDDIDIGVMWHALPLLHKYDCAAARQVY